MFLYHTDAIDSKRRLNSCFLGSGFAQTWCLEGVYTMETTKHSRMQAFREVFQTIFPRAKIRQERRMRRRAAFKRMFTRKHEQSPRQ